MKQRAAESNDEGGDEKEQGATPAAAAVPSPPSAKSEARSEADFSSSGYSETPSPAKGRSRSRSPRLLPPLRMRGSAAALTAENVAEVDKKATASATATPAVTAEAKAEAMATLVQHFVPVAEFQKLAKHVESLTAQIARVESKTTEHASAVASIDDKLNTIMQALGVKKSRKNESEKSEKAEDEEETR